MTNINEKILNDIKKNQDQKYQKFQSNLCPNVNNIIGIRVPDIRKYVRKLHKEEPDYLKLVNIKAFKYYEEVLIFGLYIATSKFDTDKLLFYLDQFVPLIDNWAVCDIVCGSIKVNEENKTPLYNYIKKYYNSKKEFERRFFVVMLFHYLDDKHIATVIKDINNLNTNDYYVSMAVAWLISFIYIKNKDKCMQFLNNNSLDTKTYNKALQKIIESTRVSKEEKELIKSLKKEKEN